MDWTIFHLVNEHLAGHPALTEEMADFTVWSVPVLAIATCCLWLLDRPGNRPRGKMMTASALTAAGLALAVNQVIGHIVVRERPTVAHPAAHLFFVPSSADPSFPSDHAGAAFAIAFAVLFLSRRIGWGFIVMAAAIAVDRVMVGLHYPGDVVGGLLVGLFSAWIVMRFGRRPLERIVGWVSAVTDPVMRPAWNVLSRRGRTRTV